MSGIGKKFAAAWIACRNPDLDSTNPHYGNRYASLLSTLAAVREACAAQGIAYAQRVGRVDGRLVIESSVTDGEEWQVLSSFPVSEGSSPQQTGSALTYAKRQQAQADWGLAGEPDDDGEAAANGHVGAAISGASSEASVAAAKQALWAACKGYAERHGLDPRSVSDGCLKRPDFDSSEAWYLSVAAELDAS